MGLFGPKRKINIPQIGRLNYLNDKQGGILAGKANDQRIGYMFEILFYVQSNELISGQLEMYQNILDQYSEIKEQVAMKISGDDVEALRLNRILIAEPFDESFDANLNFQQQEKEFSVLIKGGKILELKAH